MDPSLPDHLSSLTPEEQASFGAFANFPSDPYPFVFHASYLEASQRNLKNEPYLLPPASPSLPTSHSEQQSSSSSISSSHSVASASSSSIGSPHQEIWADMNPGTGFEPANIQDGYPQDYVPSGMDLFSHEKFPDFFVDPSLIQPVDQPHNYGPPTISYAKEPQYCFAAPSMLPPTSSPVFTPYPQTQHLEPQQHPPRSVNHSPQPSPYLTKGNASLQPPQFRSRRSSVSSVRSRHSVHSPQPSNVDVEEEGKEKDRCPHPDCGRIFKDLKAHMLTHQSERPEKCPIVNCEYHLKGFARKYDKNRHTLTHYKGTMVCGFCPGSGSAAEKSFNRADVFKRHLTSVHGVDQSAPNSRRKTPPASGNGKLSSYCQDATGKCSTCSVTFSNAQEFYEHLDDCVLRVVQQEEPSEAINLRRLTEVVSDADVKQTMERHMLTDSPVDNSPTMTDDTESNTGAGKTKSLTSSGGVTKARPTASRRRNNRNNYPPSWGCPTNKMKMKRRLLCLYDGPRRLWKDEMMLDNEFEVRLKLPAGDGMGREAYVTDLDVETMKRAEGVLNATDEEKGPWIKDPSATGLLGAAAVPIIGNASEIADEINIEELMS